MKYLKYFEQVDSWEAKLRDAISNENLEELEKLCSEDMTRNDFLAIKLAMQKKFLDGVGFLCQNDEVRRYLQSNTEGFRMLQSIG
jgi:hypothetical protein